MPNANDHTARQGGSRSSARPALRPRDDRSCDPDESLQRNAACGRENRGSNRSHQASMKEESSPLVWAARVQPVGSIRSLGDMVSFTALVTTAFARWLRKSPLAERDLCDAIKEMTAGLVDADLGGHVFEKRVAAPSRHVPSQLI
jgi:hypothetical protein